MKCLVCGKDFDAAECPVCGFPELQLMGNVEAELARLAPVIQQNRTKLLKDTRIDLMVYRWKVQDGKVLEDSKEWVSLGSGDELRQGGRGPVESFVRVSKATTLPISVRITHGDYTRTATANVACPPSDEPQRFSAFVKDDCSLYLQLESNSQKSLSPAIPLFA